MKMPTGVVPTTHFLLHAYKRVSARTVLPNTNEAMCTSVYEAGKR